MTLANQARTATPKLEDTPAPSAPWRGRLQWCVALTSLLGVLLALCLHQPAFYRERRHMADAERRKERSREFLKTATQFFNDLQNGRPWSVEIQEEDINAWLEEDFAAQHSEQCLPSGVSHPRLAMGDNDLQLGVQYQWWKLATVARIALRAWTPKPNVLVIEIRGAWAGAMPLSSAAVRRVFERIATTNNFEISWKRNAGRLAAVVQFPRGRSDAVLHRVEIKQGSLLIEGGSDRAAYPATDYAPVAN